MFFRYEIHTNIAFWDEKRVGVRTERLNTHLDLSTSAMVLAPPF